MGTRKSGNVRPLEELEARVARLEHLVRDLAASATAADNETSSATRPWYVAGAGRFANDPVFDQIVKLGRAYRRSLDRPPKRGKRAAPRH